MSFFEEFTDGLGWIGQAYKAGLTDKQKRYDRVKEAFDDKEIAALSVEINPRNFNAVINIMRYHDVKALSKMLRYLDEDIAKDNPWWEIIKSAATDYASIALILSNDFPKLPQLATLRSIPVGMRGGSHGV